ncbi:uncharacterized protein RCC_03841 [Ramularia collo-cygni]|uniref:Uncharacterized protein n=1 Tax=Ramularia collo-cygni TaxID=112498 RepID=A0A2D3VBY6_9PEZI|nr:uncharacterized protein RCC_03841 [Ramularia collo-cygni]CZT18003.1 uncharacterized protein RCC_03841 [Ramularia collo-cygni]
MSSPKTNESPVRKSTDSAGRRRSSSGMFAGMQEYKRESPAHAARRASIKEQSIGSGGLLANVWNSTFKGDKK